MYGEKDITCPACGNKLSKIKIEDIIVDVCENGCGGIWFDRGELKKVNEKHKSAGESLLNIQKNECIIIDTSIKRKCPICKDIIMKKHFSSIKRTVEIDECCQCGGIWLDYGELEKIRNEFESNDKRIEQTKQFYTIYASQLFADNSDKELDKITGIVSKIFFFLF
ncbi:MAG: zf-TFIIB domain-containing protein [bacterium]